MYLVRRIAFLHRAVCIPFHTVKVVLNVARIAEKKHKQTDDRECLDEKYPDKLDKDADLTLSLCLCFG